jgi:hypothetical protein
MTKNDDECSHSCPGCGSGAHARSVPGIVRSGTSAAVGAMPIARPPRSVPNADGSGMVLTPGGTAYRPMGWVERSHLAALLACPPAGSFIAWNSFWWWVLSAFLVYIASSTVLCLFVAAACLVVYLRHFRRKNVAKQEALTAAWRRRRAVWDELLYCERCDGVYLPGEETWARAERMHGYIERVAGNG